MPVTRFEELAVWQKARAMNKRVYQLTQQRPMVRDPSMSDQMRRASLSVMNNIAEGFERFRRTEFMQYLSTSKGSAGEVRSMLYAALDVGHIDQQTFDELFVQAEELAASIGRFRSGLARSQPKQPRRP